MWRRVELAARDDVDGLCALEVAARTAPTRRARSTMTRSDWDAALEEYYAEHDAIAARRGRPRPRAADVVETAGRGVAGAGRPSTTPRATTTG